MKYSVVKRKAFLTYAAVGMMLDNVVLGKISQMQKDRYCIIPLT